MGKHIQNRAELICGELTVIDWYRMKRSDAIDFEVRINSWNDRTLIPRFYSAVKQGLPVSDEEPALGHNKASSEA